MSGYLVKIWVDAIRDKPTNFKALEIDSDDWAYRYRARFVIECDGKQITDQRGIDNMLSIGDVINSAYRWMANNGLQRKHGARHPNLLLWGNAEFESHEEYVLRNASNAGGKASEI